MATVALPSLSNSPPSLDHSTGRARHRSPTRETITVTATRSSTTTSPISSPTILPQSSSSEMVPAVLSVKPKPTSMASRLYPPTAYPLVCEEPAIRSIDASGLASALHFTASQPLPASDSLFPWVHGLHPENHLQQAIFFGNMPHNRGIPRCYRGITLVKAGGDMSFSKLKGACAPHDILPIDPQISGFIQSDPPTGYGIRNFQIQVAKFATVSDIVVYGDELSTTEEIMGCAKRIANAQKHFRDLKSKGDKKGMLPEYNTFVVTSPFLEIQALFPELVAIKANGTQSEDFKDFSQMERAEMAEMSKATEIHHNVFLGCAQDVQDDAAGAQEYDIIIECTDHGRSPRPEELEELVTRLSHGRVPQHIEFPASGGAVVINWSHNEMTRIMDFCGWLYRYTYGDFGSDSESVDSDGDATMRELNSRSQTHRVLITCNDGYTETSLLALAYTMYAKALPTHKAWLYLHKNKGRNFFAYRDDLRLLRRLQSALLQRSPASPVSSPSIRVKIPDPSWAVKMDGSFPSRILPHLYLGNLEHANNYEMLHEIGIHRVLSIGEPVSWSNDNELGVHNMCIDNLQDNGMDSLTKHINRCLKYIEDGKNMGLITLVHCRVGVSRSATICIAEVMKSRDWGVAKAYCYVRARRLNVIIQPHCRFLFELLKWEEKGLNKEGETGRRRREIEWPQLASEVARLNRPHSGY